MNDTLCCHINTKYYTDKGSVLACTFLGLNLHPTTAHYVDGCYRKSAFLVTDCSFGFLITSYYFVQYVFIIIPKKQRKTNLLSANLVSLDEFVWGTYPAFLLSLKPLGVRKQSNSESWVSLRPPEPLTRVCFNHVLQNSVFNNCWRMTARQIFQVCMTRPETFETNA